MPLLLEPYEPLHPISVEDYHRMIDAGILTEDDKVELLEGAIIEMSPEGPPHHTACDRLNRFLVRGLTTDDLMVSPGHPITLQPRSEPEPDLYVYRTAEGSFSGHPESALLVIEVSSSSLRKDRIRKARIYASAAIPEYWIFDLKQLCVEVHRDPADGAYRDTQIVRPPAELRAAFVDLPPLPLAEILDPG
jgi:Uma2 family endonuclease